MKRDFIPRYLIMHVGQTQRLSKKQAANQRKKQVIQKNIDDLTERWEYFRINAETKTILTSKFNDLNDVQEKWLSKLIVNYGKIICTFHEDLIESFWKKEIVPRVLAKYSCKLDILNEDCWVSNLGKVLLNKSKCSFTIGSSDWIPIDFWDTQNNNHSSISTRYDDDDDNNNHDDDNDFLPKDSSLLNYFNYAGDQGLNPIDKIRFVQNSQDRFSERSARWFQTQEPWNDCDLPPRDDSSQLKCPQFYHDFSPTRFGDGNTMHISRYDPFIFPVIKFPSLK